MKKYLSTYFNKILTAKYQPRLSNKHNLSNVYHSKWSITRKVHLLYLWTSAGQFLETGNFSFEFCSLLMGHLFMKLVLYNKHLVSTVDTDGLFRTGSYTARICYIAAKNATERKAISIELKALNVTIGFDLDLEFSRSNMEFAVPQPKMFRLPPNENQTYRLNSRPQIWPWPLTIDSCYLTMGGPIDIEQRRWK